MAPRRLGRASDLHCQAARHRRAPTKRRTWHPYSPTRYLGVQLDLFFGKKREAATGPDTLSLSDRVVPLKFVRHDRARRYVLRLSPEGVVRVTVPRRASLQGARQFAESQREWIERQLARRAALPALDPRWSGGTVIWYRGEKVGLLVELAGDLARIRFADQVLNAPAVSPDVRQAVESHLHRLAVVSLPPRVFELAASAELRVRRVHVRNQRTRWGSCSQNGTISLNWRLIQTPDEVRDYVVWHELMHLREMNHSPRFWRAVAGVCPGFEAGRSWLRQHGASLR